MRNNAARAGLVPLAIFLCACGTAARQYRGAAETGGDPGRGLTAVARYGCGSCHTVPRVSGAQGMVGPPLTNIGKRLYVAGELANTPENLMHWIAHPTQVNEKTIMPELGVTPADARDIAAFLYSLD